MDLSRRELIGWAASEIGLRLSGGTPQETVLTARVTRHLGTSDVWEIGPPGRRLQRFAEALAPHYIQCASGGAEQWQLWRKAIETAPERVLQFDDWPLQGDWFDVPTQLRHNALVAGLALEIQP
jgi:hypothetical protein